MVFITVLNVNKNVLKDLFFELFFKAIMTDRYVDMI